MGEKQYLDLIRRILEEGSIEEGRNGKTKVVIGEMMRFSLGNNYLPLLTTKKLAWRTCLKELLWFISGSTNNITLQNQKVNIWTQNAQDYLEKNPQKMEGDLGPIYGHQWRHFNAKYIDCNTNYEGKGIDQLNNIIEMLQDNDKKYSRRMVVSAWNPCQINEMALPPCHVLFQFHVTGEDKLSLTLYQRSGDVGLGVPFNIGSYSFLLHLIAFHCNLKAYELIYFLGNAHIYDDHLGPLKEQSERTPLSFPKLKINRRHLKIEDYTIDDFEVLEYQYCDPIKMNMRK